MQKASIGSLLDVKDLNIQSETNVSQLSMHDDQHILLNTKSYVDLQQNDQQLKKQNTVSFSIVDIQQDGLPKQESIYNLKEERIKNQIAT